MARSLAGGDFRLVVAIESESAPERWYRVLEDVTTGALSCDCPRWTFKRRGQPRTCKHAETALALQGGRLALTPLPATPSAHGASLLAAIADQWRGLSGAWRLEEHALRVGRAPYHRVRVTLDTPDGTRAAGQAAFAARHGTTTARLIPGVAGWIGYALAAQVARAVGFALVGQPPEHFRPPARAAGGIGLVDILRVADRTALGDGLTPAARAERTLQLFLGEEYARLAAQGFLDIPSLHFAGRERVYRLRRDPQRRVRRLRVFEFGRYVHDYCVVPAAAVPEADHLLTLFLQLATDERSVLSVVRRGNVFPPFSDGPEPETVPARWYARAAA